MQWPEDIVAPFSFEELEWLEKRHEMPAFGEEKPNAARSKKMSSRGRLLDSCGMRVRRSICTCVYERGCLKYAVRGSISCPTLPFRNIAIYNAQASFWCTLVVFSSAGVVFPHWGIGRSFTSERSCSTSLEDRWKCFRAQWPMRTVAGCSVQDLLRTTCSKVCRERQLTLCLSSAKYEHDASYGGT